MDYTQKGTLNLQEAVRDLNERLTKMENASKPQQPQASVPYVQNAPKV